MRLKHWFYTVPLRLRSLFRRGQVEQELDEELRYHIERQMEEHIAKGMTPEEARDAALRALGGVEQRKEECRDMRRVKLIEDLAQDVRYGLRTLRKSPGFTAVAALTLALGIGANTAIFGIVNAVLLRPLPFPDSQRLVSLEEYPWLTVANFRAWREQNRSCAQIAAFYPREYNLTGEAETELIEGVEVSSGFFSLLGVAPAAGREFLAEEELPGNDRVVILSHDLWRRLYGGAPAVLGREMKLNGESYTVVGVMPANFEQFPLNTRKPALWVPLALIPTRADGAQNSLIPVARLRSGVTLAQANAEFEIKQAQLKEQRPELFRNSRREAQLGLLHEQIVKAAKPSLMLLWAAVGLVLLIACANVANLLLARASTRRRETAIRAALGASRLRLARQFLTESALLNLCGGGLGVLLANWGLGFCLRLLPENMPQAGRIGIDRAALGFTLLISVVTGIVFGLAPALAAAKTDVQEILKEGAKTSGGGLGRHGALQTFVVSEIALALVLMIGAGLAVHSFLRLQRVNPGFNPDHVLTMRLKVPDNKFTTMEELSGFYQQILARIETAPGAQAVGLSNNLPLSRSNSSRSVYLVERAEPISADFGVVSRDYFRTLQIPVRKGRVFTDADTRTAAGVAVIDETFARQYFPHETPTGKLLRIGQANNPWLEIIGVVGDIKGSGVEAATRPGVYIPYQQRQGALVEMIVGRNMTLLLRAVSDPSGVASAVRQAVRSVDPNQAVTEIRAMEQVLTGVVAPPRFRAWLLGLFAGAALLLAGAGIFGVISYSVAQRTNEIGIRMALGAQPRDVLKLVIGQGMKLALIGVGLGLIASFALTRLMSNLLFGVSATDPATFIIIALLLMLVALLACYLPARRATKIDPIVALRRE